MANKLHSHSSAVQPLSNPQVAEALTVGVIARLLGVPIHRVTYIIRTRALTPRAKAGSAFIFDGHQVEFIGKALRREVTAR